MFYLFSKLQVMILNIHQCQNVKNIYLLRFFPSISACFHSRLEDIGYSQNSEVTYFDINFSMFSLSVRRHRILTKQRSDFF